MLVLRLANAYAPVTAISNAADSGSSTAAQCCATRKLCHSRPKMASPPLVLGLAQS